MMEYVGIEFDDTWCNYSKMKGGCKRLHLQTKKYLLNGWVTAPIWKGHEHMRNHPTIFGMTIIDMKCV